MENGLVPTDDSYEKVEAKARKIQQEEITVEGFTVKIGDLFPSTYEATEFYSKLELLRKGSGKSARTEEELEGDLF